MSLLEIFKKLIRKPEEYGEFKTIKIDKEYVPARTTRPHHKEGWGKK